MEQQERSNFESGMQVLADAPTGEQPQMLKEMFDAADPGARKAAAAAIFPDVTPTDRFQLYRTILWILASLALVALILGTVALVNGKESAAFFTFAGLALGGLTGILVPSPSSTSS